MSTREMTATTDHHEWLDDFTNAWQNTQVIFNQMDTLINACYQVGNDRLGDTLSEYVSMLRRETKVMDDTISQMIHEQAQESWDQIGETFKALLEISASNHTTGNREGRG